MLYEAAGSTLLQAIRGSCDGILLLTWFSTAATVERSAQDPEKAALAADMQAARVLAAAGLGADGEADDLGPVVPQFSSSAEHKLESANSTTRPT